jgi:hypothetical protein
MKVGGAEGKEPGRDCCGKGVEEKDRRLRAEEKATKEEAARSSRDAKIGSVRYYLNL